MIEPVCSRCLGPRKSCLIRLKEGVTQLVQDSQFVEPFLPRSIVSCSVGFLLTVERTEFRRDQFLLMYFTHFTDVHTIAMVTLELLGNSWRAHTNTHVDSIIQDLHCKYSWKSISSQSTVVVPTEIPGNYLSGGSNVSLMMRMTFHCNVAHIVC
jgi:hypothetical protein